MAEHAQEDVAPAVHLLRVVRHRLGDRFVDRFVEPGHLIGHGRRLVGRGGPQAQHRCAQGAVFRHQVGDAVTAVGAMQRVRARGRPCPALLRAALRPVGFPGSALGPVGLLRTAQGFVAILPTAPGKIVALLRAALGLLDFLRAGLRRAHVRHDRLDDLGQVIAQRHLVQRRPDIHGPGERDGVLDDGFNLTLDEVRQPALHAVHPVRGIPAQS
ncbi:hypothetical protein [Agrilutibacter solisilvae]|uniref:Uncharacterized protein n=1 Tax=Agrilutibacter solisilvae TaxID=2763317 RepID=A0A975ARN1_9GAMM|nr:hypothetical protein [Lysobacter solisilvae]QSX78064.1 hypothetical protein I8J32_015350 [Lysobacter solisilvae]